VHTPACQVRGAGVALAGPRWPCKRSARSGRDCAQARKLPGGRERRGQQRRHLRRPTASPRGVCTREPAVWVCCSDADTQALHQGTVLHLLRPVTRTGRMRLEIDRPIRNAARSSLVFRGRDVSYPKQVRTRALSLAEDLFPNRMAGPSDQPCFRSD